MRKADGGTEKGRSRLDCQFQRSTPSYIEYMTAAFGTTRMRWALSPPYNDRAPSSAMTVRNVCQRPVYLRTPLTRGCRSRVRSTLSSPLEQKTTVPISAETYLVWICNQTSNALGRSCTTEHRKPLCSTTLSMCIHREPLQPFIKDPLDGALGDTEIARAEALVETTNTLFLEYKSDHRPTSAYDSGGG